MDSNRLKHFLVVSETGSIRKAAELLHLSPAALSKSIKIFEAELRINLITPSGRGIVITEEGKELAKKAKPHVESLERLAINLHQLEINERRPIRLGSFEVFTTHFLSGLLATLPHEQGILLREVIPGEMEKALLDQEIDFGITYIPIPTAGVDHQQVAIIEMGVFGPLKYADTKFEDLPFVVPVQPISGSPNKVQGLDGWPDDKRTRKIEYQVTLMESALELCRQGKAVGYFPTIIVAMHNEIVKAKYQLYEIKCPSKGLYLQKQSVFLARRKSDPEGSIYKKMARAIRMSCLKK